MTLDNHIRELIALGAAVGANCHPCLQHHAAKSREQGVPDDEIAQAIDVGRTVRKGAQASMDKLVNQLLNESRTPAPQAGCGCGA
jgi:AhpD family alkylhydroperoxidase